MKLADKTAWGRFARKFDEHCCGVAAPKKNGAIIWALRGKNDDEVDICKAYIWLSVKNHPFPRRV
ncbi:MAG TPA: hypothetical protein PKD37_04065 [Oligoflexia bacterium]|nr:hypothetical protein [Oligoflexia bacterium]HMP27142.1 hypothetical protein [Oligoflexia bacterium]